MPEILRPLESHSRVQHRIRKKMSVSHPVGSSVERGGGTAGGYLPGSWYGTGHGYGYG